MGIAVEDDWDFYACLVDGERASIFLNLALAKVAPIAELNCMAYLRLYMQKPRADGLSSQEEFETLVSIEDAIVPLLIEPGKAMYVGRNTSGGCRDFYFYTAHSDEWEAKASGAMGGFPQYQFDVGIREDAEWSSYFTFLYPSERSRETMQNRRTCDVLKSRGDDLSKVREIDHWIYFPSATLRDQFVEEASKQGFMLRCMTKPSDGDKPFGVQVYRSDAAAEIDNPVLALFDLAHNIGGEYDGWECPVVG